MYQKMISENGVSKVYQILEEQEEAPEERHEYILKLLHVTKGVPGCAVRKVTGLFDTNKQAWAHAAALVEEDSVGGKLLGDQGFVAVMDVQRVEEPEPVCEAALCEWGSPVAARQAPEWARRNTNEAILRENYFAPGEPDEPIGDSEDAMDSREVKDPMPSAWKYDHATDDIRTHICLRHRTGAERALEREIKRGKNPRLIYQAIQRALEANQISKTQCRRLWDIYRIEQFIKKATIKLADGFSQLNK